MRHMSYETVSFVLIEIMLYASLPKFPDLTGPVHASSCLDPLYRKKHEANEPKNPRYVPA